MTLTKELSNRNNAGSEAGRRAPGSWWLGVEIRPPAKAEFVEHSFRIREDTTTSAVLPHCAPVASTMPASIYSAVQITHDRSTSTRSLSILSFFTCFFCVNKAHQAQVSVTVPTAARNHCQFKFNPMRSIGQLFGRNRWL